MKGTVTSKQGAGVLQDAVEDTVSSKQGENGGEPKSDWVLSCRVF